MKIVAHSDHAAVAIRQEMIEQARAMGHEVDDLGPAEGESVDHPTPGPWWGTRWPRGSTTWACWPAAPGQQNRRHSTSVGCCLFVHLRVENRLFSPLCGIVQRLAYQISSIHVI